jgi:phosphoribosyl-dephospho-CoA transferase
MITFNRHDLVWLHIDSVKHAEYAGPLPMEPMSALSLLHRWVLSGYPLIVARQDEVLPNCLRVGLAEPPSWGKRRLSFVVSVQGIQTHQHGPGVGVVVPQLPQQWQAGAVALHDFLDQQNIAAHVYGSGAVQLLTGLPCLTESSDLDVLFKPTNWLEAEKLCLFLNALQTEYPDFKVDGEVLNTSGQAVQWRELYRSFSDPDSQLLVKTNRAVTLVGLSVYRSGFQCTPGSAV